MRNARAEDWNEVCRKEDWNEVSRKGGMLELRIGMRWVGKEEC